MRGACSFADLIVVEWAGAEHGVTTLDLKGLNSPESLAIDPAGTVPLLVDGTFVPSENIETLGYLAETFPARSSSATARGVLAPR
ncbi:hypothetical protein BE17_26790 [Sorangium cellulosum]|uniref:GST N-terminal domain-containing protein n=1 Tax=Sorangium cellulosum TaxID=56 RepID=A0A150RBK7_SORCE|nr:hypothetical protein BE17_26790 [Sorangium cellulosum]